MGSGEGVFYGEEGVGFASDGAVVGRFSDEAGGDEAFVIFVAGGSVSCKFWVMKSRDYFSRVLVRRRPYQEEKHWMGTEMWRERKLTGFGNQSCCLCFSMPLALR